MENKQNVCFEEIVSLLNEQITTVKVAVPGKSMEPFLVFNRDSVNVSRIRDDLKIGDIAVFRRNRNTYVVHRISKIFPNGDISFIGDNELNEEICKRENIVFGVYSAVRNGKTITPKSFVWKFFKYFWSCMIFRKIARKLIRLFLAKGESR